MVRPRVAEIGQKRPVVSHHLNRGFRLATVAIAKRFNYRDRVCPTRSRRRVSRVATARALRRRLGKLSIAAKAAA